MRQLWLGGVVAALGIMATGCNVGNAPEPMSENKVKEEVAKLTPQQQIDWINRSPMPPEEKQKEIDKIKAKYGISGEATGASGAPGAAGGGAAPTGGATGGTSN